MVSYKRAYKKLIKIIIILAIIEVSAQTISFIYKYGIYKFNKSGKGEFKILCIGDSITFGLGSPVEFSYPYQLERLLNKRSNGKIYKLINAAVPGFTSFEAKENLDAFLERYDPNMVILLIGTNDWWKVFDMPKIPFMNFNNYNEIIIKVKLVLNKIFLFRLIDIASLNIKSLYDKIKEKNIPQEAYLQPKERQEREFLTKFIRNNLCDIIYRLKRKNIEIILMTYPRGYNLTNQVIRDIAKSFSIRLVDNEILFKNLDDGYFCIDGRHPNAYGNILTVINVYRTLKGLDGWEIKGLIMDIEPVKIRQYITDIETTILKENEAVVSLDNLHIDLEKIYNMEKMNRINAHIKWNEEFGLKINTNYIISEKILAKPGEYYLEVTAYGTPLYNVYPEIIVNFALGGEILSKRQIGRFFVNKDPKIYKTDNFTLDKENLVYIFVEFINDAYERDVGDRNLFIKNIILKKK